MFPNVFKNLKKIFLAEIPDQISIWASETKHSKSISEPQFGVWLSTVMWPVMKSLGKKFFPVLFWSKWLTISFGEEAQEGTFDFGSELSSWTIHTDPVPWSRFMLIVFS